MTTSNKCENKHAPSQQPASVICSRVKHPACHTFTAGQQHLELPMWITNYLST